MLHNLLIYRLAILNIIGAAIVGWAALHGWVQFLYNNEHTGIIYLITALFAYSTLGVFMRGIKVAGLLNQLKQGVSLDLSPDKFLAKGQWLWDNKENLIYLGIIGTTIGFVIATQGVDTAALTTDQGVLTTVINMLSGMSVAFINTFAATFFMLWHGINLRVLNTATISLLEDSAK